MHEILNDPVEVVVDFCGKRVRPTTVRWGGQTYAIERVNLVHGVREGTKRIYYFSVSDKTNFMKLRLDTEMLEWRLVEIYTE
ncbi:MAG: hypothetical protein NUV56_01230 [Candidatus Uhrbacteria bacterium]|nr:hypothetical protein [Candidatus Uhrbacteria bacterium]